MQLVNLAWDARAQRFIAFTDVGAFSVPNVPGGWAQRTPTRVTGTLAPLPDVKRAAVFLGMVAGPWLGGCGCMGRR